MDSTFGWIIGIGAAFAAVAIYLGIEESRQWSRFSAAHQCKIVGKTNGDVGVGFVSGGQNGGGIVTTFTPGKTGWQCDDGVTYWR